MILRRTGGLAASPPVPYRLKVAETVLLDRLAAAAESRDDLRVRTAGEVADGLHFVIIPTNGHEKLSD
jgi:hypothetical protein